MGLFSNIKDAVSGLIHLDDTELYDDENNFPEEIVENQFEKADDKAKKVDNKKMSIPNFIPNPVQTNYQQQTTFGNGMMQNQNAGFMQGNNFQQQFPNMQNQFMNQNYPQQNMPNMMPNMAQAMPNQQQVFPQNANQNMGMFNQNTQQPSFIQQLTKPNSNFDNVNSNYNNKNLNQDKQNKQDNVKMFFPQSFDEVEEIATLIKNGGTAIISMEGMTYDLSTRIIDFLSGLMFAFDGNMKEIQDNVYIASFTQSLDQGFKPMDEYKQKKIASNNPFRNENPFMNSTTFRS